MHFHHWKGIWDTGRTCKEDGKDQPVPLVPLQTEVLVGRPVTSPVGSPEGNQTNARIFRFQHSTKMEFIQKGSLVPSQHHLTKGRQVSHHLFWVPVSLSVTWFLIQRGKLHRTIPLGSNTVLAAPAFFVLCPQYPAWAPCYPLIRNHQHSTWWQSFPLSLWY